ncbi:MAG: flagellar basal body L-ring protein FlgH [Bdellovibrionota bacterium]
MMTKLFKLLLLSLLIQSCAGLKRADEVAQIERELKAVEPAAPAPAPAPLIEEKKSDDVAVQNPDEEPMTRYSELNNMAPPSDRQYKRMTRQKMEEDSALNSSAGSLWKMEGQTSYLFAQNKHRRQGDPTSIKMEGAALKLIENKVAVISDLLRQLEDQKLRADEEEKKLQAEKLRLAQVEEEKKLRAERIARGDIVVDPMEELEQLEKNQSEKNNDGKRKPAGISDNRSVREEKVDLKEIENIPSKIVEKMSDDIYRIRGQQFLTIKKKSYKVIATALIRAEDFNDNSVSSSKLLDAQYDLIHVKRTAE